MDRLSAQAEAAADLTFGFSDGVSRCHRVRVARWVREQWHAGAEMLHERPLPRDRRRRISVLRPRRPTVVLGSAGPNPFAGLVQTADFAVHTGVGEVQDLSNPEAAAWDLVRRRSGGGAVWLDPALSTWIDVFVPSGDPLWHRDVGEAFGWLGNRLVAAFKCAGVPATAFGGAYQPGPSGGLVCFASRGRGEVLVDERKLVGISQRRTREGARFQCAWNREFQLGPLASVLDRHTAVQVRGRAVGWAEFGIDLTESQLTSLVLEHIAADD